jgi:hypothetical protein
MEADVLVSMHSFHLSASSLHASDAALHTERTGLGRSIRGASVQHFNEVPTSRRAMNPLRLLAVACAVNNANAHSKNGRGNEKIRRCLRILTMDKERH